MRTFIGWAAALLASALLGAAAYKVVLQPPSLDTGLISVEAEAGPEPTASVLGSTLDTGPGSAPDVPVAERTPAAVADDDGHLDRNRGGDDSHSDDSHFDDPGRSGSGHSVTDDSVSGGDD